MEVEKRWSVEALSVMADDLRRIAKRCKKRKTFTQLDYASGGGRYSPSTICRVFGSWHEAKKVAGLVEMWEPEVYVTLTCLRCDRPFQSWDRKRNRLCEGCRNLKDWATLP